MHTKICLDSFKITVTCFRLDEDGTLKIADFGLAKDMCGQAVYHETNPNMILPIRWMSPESIGSRMFSLKSDVVRTVH